MFEYNAVLDRVVDGDTVDATIDLGFDTWKKTRIRFYGINTPESRTRDLEEKAFGLAAKQYVKDLMPIGSQQIIKTEKDKTGKFGRVLGDFIIEGKLLTELMIENNHAVPYHGQSKEDVKSAHLINRSKLLESGLVKLED